MAPQKFSSLMTGAKDYVLIVLGLMLYSLGFCAFILPHEVVIGGLSGVGTLVYFATKGMVPVAVTQYACNLVLLSFAFKIVGKTFVMRTIFGATAGSYTHSRAPETTEHEVCR
ncbi:MAG: YitT family protein, partial [Muribaculaceae bacterium]|nr:YitT family protein [Muribaculaceae bacterium]